MPFEEINGSPRKTLTAHGGHTIVRTFIGPWADADSFALALFGSGDLEYPTCYPDSINIEPYNDEHPASGIAGAAQYSLARVVATYTTSQWNWYWPADVPSPDYDPETILALETDGGAEFLTIPSRTAEWGTGAGVSPGETDPNNNPEAVGGDDPPLVPEDQINKIIVPTTEFSVRWDWVDDPPIDKIRKKVGGVNDAIYMGQEQDTLLLEGYGIQRSYKPAADPRCYAMTLRFNQRRIRTADGSIVGWNHDYREDPPGWQEVLLNGAPRYERLDFSDLFEQ